MKSKPEKQKDLETLRAELMKAANVFLTGYEKLTVQQDYELRKTVRSAGAKYKVVKNTIAGTIVNPFQNKTGNSVNPRSSITGRHSRVSRNYAHSSFP